MTNKQKLILDSALQLISEEGFHATSTSKIAKYAGVSEGLIFRHYKSKLGLGKALINYCGHQLLRSFHTILVEEDPKTRIYRIIELPFLIPIDDLKYWTLLYKLSWELDGSIKPFESIKESLIKAFLKLRYKDPETESQFLMHHLDAIITSIIRHEDLDEEHLKTFLLRKYHLQ